MLLFLDAEQADAADVRGPLVHVFSGQEADTENCLNDIQKSLPFRVAGEVGCAQARTSKKYLVGLFNNLGVTKTSQGESGDPTATRQVSITGRCAGLEFVTGPQYVRTATEKSVTLDLPAGSVALLSFDQP